MSPELRQKLDMLLREEHRAEMRMARSEYRLLAAAHPRQQRVIIRAYLRNRRSGYKPFLAMYHVELDVRW